MTVETNFFFKFPIFLRNNWTTSVITACKTCCILRDDDNEMTLQNSSLKSG